jgi:hypothetical protein
MRARQNSCAGPGQEETPRRALLDIKVPERLKARSYLQLMVRTIDQRGQQRAPPG